jgi:hypothetical protein
VDDVGGITMTKSSPMDLKELQVYLAVCADNPLRLLLDTIPGFLDDMHASGFPSQIFQIAVSQSGV